MTTKTINERLAAIEGEVFALSLLSAECLSKAASAAPDRAKYLEELLAKTRKTVSDAEPDVPSPSVKHFRFGAETVLTETGDLLGILPKQAS